MTMVLDTSSTDAMHWAECYAEQHGGDAGLLVVWFAKYWAAVHDPLSRQIDELEKLVEIEGPCDERIKELEHTCARMQQEIVQRQIERDKQDKRIEELEALLPKAYNEGIGEGMREMIGFHGAKDWEETVSFSKMRKATGR